MSTLNTYLELTAGGAGSGCNPKVANPRCGRPNKKVKPIKFKVKYTKGKKTYFLKRFENMNQWLYEGQERPPFQQRFPPKLTYTTDPSKAALVSRAIAEQVDHILWKAGKNAEIVPTSTLIKKKIEREVTKSKSKLGKAIKEELKDKGALISMRDKGIKYEGTPTTSRRIIDEKSIKVKVGRKLVDALVTVVKPTGKDDQRTGTRRPLIDRYNVPHMLNGRFSLFTNPIKNKSEGRTTWIYDAEDGKAPGSGASVILHQIKSTPTKSRIIVQEAARGIYAEIYKTTEFKFKSGKPAKAFLYERYGIKHNWSK